MIKFRNVTYFYDVVGNRKKDVLKNISFEIEKGDYVCVIGHTGSGKTTLLKILGGMLKPKSGNVYIDGYDIFKEKNMFRKIRKDIGFIFQNAAHQLFEETVEKDIAFGPKNFEFSKEEIENRVKKAALLVGLDEKTLKKSPFDVSGGQKKRAAIAGVISLYPKVLLLDEPTCGLDPIGKKKILDIVKKYNIEEKATVVFITHNMEDIFSYANKILVLNEGEIFSFSEVKETFKKVEELQEIGLDIPDISKVFLKLKQMGIVEKCDVFSVEEAVLFIKNIILKKEKKI